MHPKVTGHRTIFQGYNSNCESQLGTNKYVFDNFGKLRLTLEEPLHSLHAYLVCFFIKLITCTMFLQFGIQLKFYSFFT